MTLQSEVMNVEIWKPIENYEGLYEVSSWGRIKSCKRELVNILGRKHTIPEKIMKLHFLPNGYVGIGLHKNNKKKDFYVHRLVANAFIPNTNNLPEVNHKDEDKQNNKFDNLEWCTDKENKNYGTYILRMAATKRRKGGKRIEQYTLDGTFVRKYNSIKDAAQTVGVSNTAIKDTLMGKQKQSAGFAWKWANG